MKCVVGMNVNPSSAGEMFMKKVAELYGRIRQLPTLKPCEAVDAAFGELVRICITTSVDVDVDVDMVKDEEGAAEAEVADMRWRLIDLCAAAEGELERHYADVIAGTADPLANLRIFPYYDNYMKLANMEHGLLMGHLAPSVSAATPTAPEVSESTPTAMSVSASTPTAPEVSVEGPTLPEAAKVAFMGSGPLPLSSIVLATCMMPCATFDNYDCDARANTAAARLVAADERLRGRMRFVTAEAAEVAEEALREYDVVVVAALVGLRRPQKMRVLCHLGRHMRPGAALLVRSARGARAFLYPVVDPTRDVAACGFRVVSVTHPTDDVVNSVILAVKI